MRFGITYFLVLIFGSFIVVVLLFDYFYLKFIVNTFISRSRGPAIVSPTNSSQPRLIFKESPHAHRWLDNLTGIEIGASAHNPFGLKTKNVDYSNNSIFKDNEKFHAGSTINVDIVAPGDQLPLANASQDFVISSHVIEHFYDPVKAIKEWLRVVKPKGYVYIVVPHKERTFDKDKERTTLTEIINRHEHPTPPANDDHHHYSIWTTQDFLQICVHYNWTVVSVEDVDDKLGIGFTVVIRKD